MKIGLISTAYAIPTPPKDFGGMERINSWIGQELVKRGHDVTLFGCHGSYLVGAREVVILPGGGEVEPREGGPYPPYFDFMCDWMVKQTHALDVFHDSTHHHEFARRLPALPSISTVHNPNSPESGNSVFISDSHRHHLGFHNHPYVMNGCPDTEYKFNPQGKDYVIFMGAFGMHKGFDLAVKFALENDVNLKLAGFPMGEEESRWLEIAKEHPRMEFLGVLGGKQKEEALSNAKAILLPFRWPEPGCIIAVEAMACGVPIIASRAGVLPEYVVDGETGFLTDGSTAEMWNAYQKIDTIDRAACRQRFMDRFTIERVVDEYEQLYVRAANGEKW